MSQKIADLGDKEGVGAAVRRLQLVGTQGVITTVLKELYRTIGDTIRSGQSDAAREAALARLVEEAPLFDILTDDQSKRTKMEDSMLSAASRGVQLMMRKILDPQYTLSQRVYRSEALAKGMVHKIVAQHLAMNSSASDLAKAVRHTIRPDVPGGVSSAAMRLARTEINNAFHAQSIADAADRPWVQHMEWHLSKSHPDGQGCLCEAYALQKNFVPSAVPRKPHPNCFCYVVPSVVDLDTFVADMETGRYTEWANEHGL